MPLKEWQSFDRVEIDASRLRFAVPTFLLRLQSFIDWHRAHGKDVLLVAPTNPSVAAYLSRMRVEPGHPGGLFGLREVHEHDRRDVLIPIVRLRSTQDVDRLDEALIPLFDAALEDVAQVAGAIHVAVAELCGNAVEHGRNKYGCYVAAQRYEEGQAGRRMVLAIGDLGIGIPAHLRRAKLGLSSDALAIARATEEGVSGTGRAERGYGFYWVMEQAQGTALRYAKLEIRSGRGQFASRLRRDGRIANKPAAAPNKRGTWITFEIGAP